MTQPRDPVGRLAACYDEEARAYRELWAPILEPFGRELVCEVAAGKATPARALDLGTGVGWLLPSLRDSFPDALLMGVDRSEGMVRLVPAPFAVAVMDGSQLALVRDSFDVAVLAFVLFHFPDPRAGLAETRRVLRAGGVIGTTTWGSEPSYPALGIWNEELDAHGARPLDPEMDLVRHDLVDTTQKMHDLLERAGFASIRTWTRPFDQRMSFEGFVALRTRLGRTKRRLDSLDPRAQAACIERASARLRPLGPESFVARSEVVFATAATPS